MKKIIAIVIGLILLIFFLSGCAAVEEIRQPKDVIFVVDSSRFESEDQYLDYVDNILNDDGLNIEYKMLVYRMMTGDEAQIFTVNIEK